MFDMIYLQTGTDYQKLAHEESQDQESRQEDRFPYGVNSVISERTFEDDPITAGNREKSVHTERELLPTERDRDLDLYSYRQQTASARSSIRVDQFSSPRAVMAKSARQPVPSNQPNRSRSGSRHQQSDEKPRQMGIKPSEPSMSAIGPHRSPTPSSGKKTSELDSRRHQMKLHKQHQQHKPETIQSVISERAVKRQQKFEEGLRGIKPFDAEVDISREIGESDLDHRADRFFEEEGILLINGKIKGLERLDPHRTSKEVVAEHEKGFMFSNSPHRESLTELTPTVLLEKIFRSSQHQKPETDRKHSRNPLETEDQPRQSARGHQTERHTNKSKTKPNEGSLSRKTPLTLNAQSFLKKKADAPVNQTQNASRGVSRNDSQSAKVRGSLGGFKGLANVLSASSGVLPEASQPDVREPIPKKQILKAEPQRTTPNRSRKPSLNTGLGSHSKVIGKTPVQTAEADRIDKAERKKGKSLRYVSDKELQRAVESSRARAEAFEDYRRTYTNQTARPSRSRSTHQHEREVHTERHSKFASGSERKLGRVSSDHRRSHQGLDAKEIEVSGWQAIETPVNSYLGNSMQGIASTSVLHQSEMDNVQITSRSRLQHQQATSNPQIQHTPRPKLQTALKQAQASPQTSVSKRVVKVPERETMKTTPVKQSVEKRPSLSRVLNSKAKADQPSRRGKEALARELNKLAPKTAEADTAARSRSRGREDQDLILDKWASQQTYKSKDLRTEDSVKQEVMLHGVREKFQTLMSDLNSKILSELKADLK